jgi:hypothetical protein
VQQVEEKHGGAALERKGQTQEAIAQVRTDIHSKEGAKGTDTAGLRRSRPAAPAPARAPYENRRPGRGPGAAVRGLKGAGGVASRGA